eukprot:scaffold153375_cov28-Attheya_sp.AAC.1
MPRRLAKENLAVDKEIALVDNWGWKGRPNPKPVSATQQKEKWAQSDVREAVSMFANLRFQSTWQTIEYVVPSMRADENPVPTVTSYHNEKTCERGTVSYFVGHGVNSECHIVDPSFLENCIATNKKPYFSQNFLEKVENNPNTKIKLLYQTQTMLKKNKTE